MYSSPHFVLDRRGAVRFIPNEDIRCVIATHDTIVVDDRYHTNNLGFIDHMDYAANINGTETGKTYAFVGNSFTAGMGGGHPWVPKLRDRIKATTNIEIYNLGVPGTSVQHFHKVLKSVSHDLPVTHIVLIAISTDLYRSLWVPITSSTEIRFCRKRELRSCRAGPPQATIIDYHAPAEAILRHVRRVAQDAIGKRSMRGDRSSDSDFSQIATMWAERTRSHLLIRFVRQLQNFRHIPPDARELEHNLRALATIRAEFSRVPIVFAHFPESEEVNAGTYSIDVKGRIEALGIDYLPLLEECPWSRTMFHPREGHPNAGGYDNVSRCLAKYLFAS